MTYEFLVKSNNIGWNDYVHTCTCTCTCQSRVENEHYSGSKNTYVKLDVIFAFLITV